MEEGGGEERKRVRREREGSGLCGGARRGKGNERLWNVQKCTSTTKMYYEVKCQSLEN